MGLKKVLGKGVLMLTGYATVVASGFAIGVGGAAEAAGPMASLSYWVIGGLATLATAFVFSELATMVPEMRWHLGIHEAGVREGPSGIFHAGVDLLVRLAVRPERRACVGWHLRSCACPRDSSVGRLRRSALLSSWPSIGLA